MSAQQYFFKPLFIIIFCTAITSTAVAETLERSYVWKFQEKNYSNTFTFSSTTYNYYKKINRKYDDFTYYMKESSSYQVIATIANTLKNIAQKERFTDKETVEFISAFVQYFTYKDDGYYEYPRFPVETLVEKAGDCEDTAILLVSILKYLGYKTVLLSPKGHMGVGIAVKENIAGNAFPYDGSNFYYIETTSAGWGVGDYPEHLSEQATIFDPGQTMSAREMTASNSTYASAGSTSKNKEETVAHHETQAQSSTKQKESSSSPQTKNSQTTNNNNTYTGTNKNSVSYTIEEDEIIINGEKETMVTKGTYNGDDVEVTATSK